MVGPDWADCCRQQCSEVRTRANSQESRACATVDIRSRPTHRQAPHTSVLRDAADRDGQLIISREIGLMPNQKCTTIWPKMAFRTSSQTRNRREAAGGEAPSRMRYVLWAGFLGWKREAVTRDDIRGGEVNIGGEPVVQSGPRRQPSGGRMKPHSPTALPSNRCVNLNRAIPV